MTKGFGKVQIVQGSTMLREVEGGLERLSVCCLVVESSSRLGVTFEVAFLPQHPQPAKSLNPLNAPQALERGGGLQNLSIWFKSFKVQRLTAYEILKPLFPALGPPRPLSFLLDQKGNKKSSSLEALPFGHHSKKQAISTNLPLRFLFVMLASERDNYLGVDGAVEREVEYVLFSR